MTLSLLRQALRYALYGGAHLGFIAGVNYQAIAQSASSEETELETITVTGSRIPRAGFVTPTPVTVLGADDIRNSGAVTVGDLVNQLPALGSTYSLSNSSRFIGTVGLGLLDLRRMGTDRTLVLVNGRRHVGGVAGSSSVDVNTIPVEWIERVEVITGGASAVYGADAVTGVVNFILKKSFEGFELRGQTGVSGEGGFNRSFGSFTAGSDFAEGRGSVGMSVELSTQDSMDYYDREIGRTQYRYILDSASGIRYLAPNAGSLGFSDGGSFMVEDVRYLFDPDGSFRLRNLGSFRDVTNCQDCDFLDINRVSELQPGYDRASFNMAGNFELAPDHRLYMEGKYVRTDANFFDQPSFSNPNPYVITRDNAYVSPQLGAFMDQHNLDSIKISRFDVDAGQRGEDVTRETTRFVFGVEGVFAGDWQYDVSANHGRTSEQRASLNNRINDRWFASIDAVRDANGTIVCRSTREPQSINPNTEQVIPEFARTGCVPTSIFGAGAVNEAARAFFNTTSNFSTVLTQTVLSASVAQSSLFEMPAGPVGFAAGVEYRKERSQQNADALAAAGLTFFNALPSRGGEYDTNDVFAELSIPLLAGMPLVDNLTFDVAGRYADYSTVGGAFSWKSGLDWTMTDELRIRSTYSKAIRAPNISELFDPLSENFDYFLDPCSASRIDTARNPAVRATNCAALGIPADFESQQAATYRGRSGGNPNLSEESADTFTLGFVYTPDWAPGFGVTLDYWDIEIADAISSASALQTAERCVDSPSGIDNVFCGLIRRDPNSHEIVFWETPLQNMQKLEASGIDLELAYKWEMFNGTFDARLIGTYLRHRRTYPFQDDPNESVESRGVLGDPERRVSIDLGYRNGPYEVSWQTRFIDGMLRVTNESYVSNPTQQKPIKVGSVSYSDAQVSRMFGEDLKLYVGIDNLFDKNPPVGLFGDGEGSALYDNVGRYYYVGANYRF